MNEMIERVARSMCDTPDALVCRPTPMVLPFTNWCFAPHPEDMIPMWHIMVPSARLAVQAMREPTEAMLEAGRATSGLCFTCNRDWVASPSVVFRAMIDEALKD